MRRADDEFRTFNADFRNKTEDEKIQFIKEKIIEHAAKGKTPKQPALGQYPRKFTLTREFQTDFTMNFCYFLQFNPAFRSLFSKAFNDLAEEVEKKPGANPLLEEFMVRMLIHYNYIPLFDFANFPDNYPGLDVSHALSIFAGPISAAKTMLASEKLSDSIRLTPLPDKTQWEKFLNPDAEWKHEDLEKFKEMLQTTAQQTEYIFASLPQLHLFFATKRLLEGLQHRHGKTARLV